MITLLTTLELATAAHRLRIAPPAARRLELIARAIQAAPDRFDGEGFALDGSTALLGVYLAPFGVTHACPSGPCRRKMTVIRGLRHREAAWGGTIS